MMAGIDMLHVPYRGAPQAITDCSLDKCMSCSMSCRRRSSTSKPDGCVRWRWRRRHAWTCCRRSPTVADFVPGYEASGWTGLGAPKSTPIDVVDRLNKEINLGLADPQMKSKLSSFGYTIVAGYACRFRQAHRGRNRKVGQGGQVRWHQAGVTRAIPTKYSVTSVPRMAGVRLCGRLDRMTRLFCCSENTSLHSRPCNFLAAIGPTTDITGL